MFRYKQSILDFNTALSETDDKSKAWATTMSKASISAQEQTRQCLKAKGSLTELANGLQATNMKAKATTLGPKALSVAGNALASMGIMLAIQLAITAFTELYNIQDKISAKTKNLTDNLNSQTDEWKSLKNELDEVNQQIKDNKDRYSELIEKQKSVKKVYRTQR